MKKTADVMSKTGKWLLVFGFIFSQLSFPLEVLADELIVTENIEPQVLVENNTDDLELVGDIQTEEPVITINGEVTEEYTISDNTEVTVILEYQGDTEIVKFDFSKKLYGVYQYTFESVEKTVTINYVGNNADLLKNCVNVSDLTKKIVCDETECIISGFGTEGITVTDITMGYYNLVAFEEEFDATVVITDNEIELADDVVVLNGYKLEIRDNQNDLVLVNTTPSTSYTINRVGDVFVPSDGLIDAKDQKTIVDDILLENDVTNTNDLNSDGVLNILDATHSTFIENVIVGEEKDILTNTLVSDKEEALIGETVKVELFVSGFEHLTLYGIEGILSYDNSILNLVGASVYSATDSEEVEELGYLNLDNNKLAYVLNNGFNNNEVALLTLEFEALAEGVSEITISNILESYGEAFEVSNDTVSVSVTVIGDGKGGDVEEDNNQTEEDNTNKEEEKKEESVVVTPVVLSSDYYIKKLTIEGYEIDFNMYTYEYSIKVGSDVDSLDFSVLLNDNNSIYYVEGNEGFKTGENFVYLVVKAQNGSTKTYTIRVEKEKEVVKVDNATEVDEDETEEEDNKNTSKTIIIILIILVIIGLIYVIFKDDEEDKNNDKKEEKTEKNNKTESVKKEQVKTNNSGKKSPKKGNKK